MDHRADPAVEHRGRLPLGDRESIEHSGHILGPIPRLAGDPSIGRKQANRLAAKIHGDRDQVAHFVSLSAFERRGLRRLHCGIGYRELGKQQRHHPVRHALGS